MAPTPSISVLGSEFDDFLFAPIGDDRNDMPLSVLSALARLDVDPWEEAAELARWPGGNCGSKTGLVDCGASRINHGKLQILELNRRFDYGMKSRSRS